MGWTPTQVDATGLWEFTAAVAGWNRAQGGEEAVKPPSPAEHDDLMAKYGATTTTIQ